MKGISVARRAWISCGLLSIILRASLAMAQAPPPAPIASEAVPREASRPWAAGVSEADQSLALNLYAAGNAEFAESRHAQALSKYRDAIKHWDHPAIRFNMAVCLIHLGSPIEAREQLEKSLAHGAAALGADAHAQALTYRKLLDAQLAHLTVSCLVPGAEVTLDGKPLFVGPGTARRYLTPGEHQVVATKAGLQTALRAVSLAAGATMAVELRPTIAISAPVQMVRRWDSWKPWAVLGGGGALVGVGGLFYLVAKGDFRDYDRLVASRCPTGCTAAQLVELGVVEEKRSAEREQIAAFSLFALGGSALILGVVGVVLNQPRLRSDQSPTALTVVPVTGGAVLSTAWEL